MTRPGLETRFKRIKTEPEETSDAGNRPPTPAQPPGFDFDAAILTIAGPFPQEPGQTGKAPHSAAS